MMGLAESDHVRQLPSRPGLSESKPTGLMDHMLAMFHFQGAYPTAKAHISQVNLGKHSHMKVYRA